MNNTKGKVYLVGAGPGDPGLITVKGKACIESADVVIYDYLASPMLLNYAHKDAERIYVGKKGGDHTLAQKGINALIIKKAEEGLTVTRLKGGDPFIFGRGGEEAEELIDAGIPYEIVPGVTSAIAAPAYAGIPLTHRKYTSSVSIITGHEDPTKSDSSINWQAVAENQGTLVFLMGVRNLPHITGKLMEHGKPSSTPIALVRWGTTLRQQTVTGTLDTIIERVEAAGLKSPAIIVVGDVVNLREKMKWFEKRPLFRKTIAVTRAREQASDLVQRLSDLGAECLECPTITIAPIEDPAPLIQAIKDLKTYDWIVFTSVNGVNFFFERLFERGLDVRQLGHLKTASIGPATAARLLQFGIKSDIVPASYRAESVVDAFRAEDIEGQHILLPRAQEARYVLPVELRKMGAIVDEVHSYCTKKIDDNTAAAELIEKLGNGDIDLITFTSSSTVKNFKAMLPVEKFEQLIANTKFASIGPITTETAENSGIKVNVTAEVYTIPGLCDAILNYFNTL